MNLDRGSYIDGWRDFEKAETLFKEVAHEVGELRSINSQGYACLMLGDTEEAFSRLNQALERSAGYDDPMLISGILNNIGETLMQMKQYNEAIVYLKRAFDLEGVIQVTQVNILNQIGIAYRKNGELDKSFEYLNRALQLTEDYDLSVVSAEVILALGVTSFFKKDYIAARQYLEKSVSLSKKVNNLKNLGESYLYFGKVFFATHDYTRSEEYYTLALTIGTEIKVPSLESKILKELSTLYVEQKRWQEAFEHFMTYHHHEKDMYGEATVKKMMLFREEQVKREAAIYKDLYQKISIINEDLESERSKLENALKEILTKNQELEKAYKDLQSAQSQLLQAEKMQSVGRMAAGIAHEINTPIQFVGDNTNFFKDSFEDIERLLIAREEAIKESSHGKCPAELLEKAKSIADEIDYEFLRTEVPLAIQQSLEGIDRVANIVQAMKKFSHPGNDEKSMSDLNQIIESTTVISSNEWKYCANLQLDLDENLPKVLCLAGDINQVILNIIINASHAIQKKHENQPDQLGSIIISTRHENNSVIIRISDSGVGIPEETRAKIFDPFFTTKDVGQGTGQGLAIAYSAIVDKHSGTIEVESEMGQGSTFTICLPLEKDVATVEQTG